MGTETDAFYWCAVNPEVVWVDGRCYRKSPVQGGTLAQSKTKSSRQATSKPIEYTIEDETDSSTDLPIQFEKNRFWITYPIPKELLKFVIGKFSAQKTAIEQATHTDLKFPTDKNTHGPKDIVIIGLNKNDVVAAYNRIHSIACSARWKVGDYTHFISVPMNSNEIQDGFLKFKEAVLQNAKGHGIFENCFEEPSKLHLTIVMLTLLDDREKETAKEVLLKLRTDILELLDGKTFNVEVKGIEYMNDDPSEVNVLYGKVSETDSDNCLQLIADKICNAFLKANFARKEYESVKLHVTLMKSRSGDQNRRTTFDARRILENYADYYFGKMNISSIHVSARHTGPVGKYYRSTYILPLDDKII